MSRNDIGSARRKVEAYRGHEPENSAYEDPETTSPREAEPTGRTSRAVRRVVLAFRRAADLTTKRGRPAAVPIRAVEQPNPKSPWPSTQVPGDEQATTPGGRSPHWPWPSTVEAVSGELASKLRPEVPDHEVPDYEAPDRDLFGKFARLLVGFLIGLAVTGIVLTIYPIHTEVQDAFSAKPPAEADGAASDSFADVDQTAATNLLAPSTRESALRSDQGGSATLATVAQGPELAVDAAAAPAKIPSVPLNLVVADANGSEDNAIPLAISTTRISDQDVENLNLTVAGLPEGARLSAGQADGPGSWTLVPNQLPGLLLTTPEHYSGRFELSVSAAIQHPGGDNETLTRPLVVNIAGVADLPKLETEGASGTHGWPIPLFLDAALVDRDGSESLSVTITGAPKDTVLSAGNGDNEDGWVLARGDLEGLTLRPPAGFTGRIDLTVTATSRETDGDSAFVTAPLAVKVNAAIDHLALSVEDATAAPDSPVRLQIDTALNSGQAAEQFSVAVAGLPEGALLSAGRDQGGGSWLLNPDELAGLSLLPPKGYSGRFELRIAATVRQADGDTVTATAPLAVEVARPTEAPGSNVASVARALGSIKGDPVRAVAAEPSDPIPPRPPTLAQTKAKELMLRGNQLLELGDIAAARLFFELAVDHGEARAATAVAKTYDPIYLRERGVQGAGGNPEMAMTWYKRAVEAGDLEAVTRLKALTR